MRGPGRVRRRASTGATGWRQTERARPGGNNQDPVAAELEDVAGPPLRSQKPIAPCGSGAMSICARARPRYGRSDAGPRNPHLKLDKSLNKTVLDPLKGFQRPFAMGVASSTASACRYWETR